MKTFKFTTQNINNAIRTTKQSIAIIEKEINPLIAELDSPLDLTAIYRSILEHLTAFKQITNDPTELNKRVAELIATCAIEARKFLKLEEAGVFDKKSFYISSSICASVEKLFEPLSRHYTQYTENAHDHLCYYIFRTIVKSDTPDVLAHKLVEAYVSGVCYYWGNHMSRTPLSDIKVIPHPKELFDSIKGYDFLVRYCAYGDANMVLRSQGKPEVEYSYLLKAFETYITTVQKIKYFPFSPSDRSDSYLENNRNVWEQTTHDADAVYSSLRFHPDYNFKDRNKQRAIDLQFIKDLLQSIEFHEHTSKL